MVRRNKMKERKYFFENILWLNYKRFKHQIIWRTLIFLINLLFLFLWCFKLEMLVYTYVFFILTFANILFLITRIQSEKDSIILLRSFGASRFFIMVDHLSQILMEIIFAAIIFILFFPLLWFYFKVSFYSFVFLIIEIIIISIVSLSYSFNTIKILEKEFNP
jgi:hypothetical protein